MPEDGTGDHGPGGRTGALVFLGTAPIVDLVITDVVVPELTGPESPPGSTNDGPACR